MPTLRCRACLRRWREGGPYACDCGPELGRTPLEGDAAMPPRSTHVRRTCAGHTLWDATAATPSADGTRVYVLCACGRPRVVTPEAWEAERARRAAAERGREHGAGAGAGPDAA